jgi:hypothetical protein
MHVIELCGRSRPTIDQVAFPTNGGPGASQTAPGPNRGKTPSTDFTGALPAFPSQQQGGPERCLRSPATRSQTRTLDNCWSRRPSQPRPHRSNIDV